VYYTTHVTDDTPTLDYFPDDAVNKALIALDTAIDKKASQEELLNCVRTVADHINKKAEHQRAALRALLAERVAWITGAQSGKKPDAA